MKKRKYILTVVIIGFVVIGLLTIFFTNQSKTKAPHKNTDAQTLQATLITEMNDITGGQTMCGVSTDGRATGKVEAGFLGDEFQVTAFVSDLPNLTNGAVYKGWLVKANPHEFFTVGELKNEGDLHKVVYSDAAPDKERLKLFTRFVVTIERSINEGPTLNLLEGGDPR